MPARRDPITGHYIYVPIEGTEYRIYYEDNGAGIPLVCMHTAGTDTRQFRHQLADPDFTHNFRMIAFDLPHHGKSNPPVGFQKYEYLLTANFYASIIKAFCDALELESPVAMGSSMGGHICMHLAYRYPGYFRALIALEAAEYTPGRMLDYFYDPRVHAEVAGNANWGLMAPESPAEDRWETWWYYAQGGPGIYRGDLNFYGLDHDFREKAAEIDGSTPIYFLTGEYDFASTPAMSAETARKIRNASFVKMTGIGHFPMCENPARFKEFILPVLSRIATNGR